MSGFRLTDAKKSDVAALARFIGDWVREVEWMPVLHTREEDEHFVAGLLASHAVRVARGGSQLLGFLARQGGVGASAACRCWCAWAGHRPGAFGRGKGG